MIALPGPDERIAELTRVLTEVSAELHSYHQEYHFWIGPRGSCPNAACRDATAALAGDYVKDGGR